MTHLVHHSAAGEGAELNAPDATVTVKIAAAQTDGGYELFEVDASRGPAAPPHRTPWSKAYYLLQGRMTVHVEGNAYDLRPGSTITIPPGSEHSFEVVTPSVKFLAVSLTDAMSRFFTDLDGTVPPGHPVDEVAPLIDEVLDRHQVTIRRRPVHPKNSRGRD